MQCYLFGLTPCGQLKLFGDGASIQLTFRAIGSLCTLRKFQRHIVSLDAYWLLRRQSIHGPDVDHCRKQSTWLDLKRQELLMVRGNPSNSKQMDSSSISLTFSPHRQARAQRACIIYHHDTHLFETSFFGSNVNSFEIYSSGGTWPYTTHHTSFFFPNSR
jgi:hypothetical protein